jgi:hypothetical protein
MSKISAYCLFVLLVAPCPGAWCQVTAKAQKQLGVPSHVCDVASSREAEFLGAVQPKLRAHFSRSFKDADVGQIECDGWSDYMKLYPHEQPDTDKFLKFVSENFGGLKVTSTPDGAAIEVDGKPWSDTTNAQNSCRVGVRHVKLTKPGYQEEVGEAIVKEGQWTLFQRDLKKK